jgi:hypothetical protein
VKIAGMAMKNNWTAIESGGNEKRSKFELILAVAGSRPELAAYLDVNMKALNSIARAMKENFHVPGFKAVNNPKASGARRK